MKPPTVLAVVFLLLLGILLWPVLLILLNNLSDSIQTRQRYDAVHLDDLRSGGIQPGRSLDEVLDNGC